jgi:predicted TIM-barrel fold metal-dependent hydrolase
VDTPNRTRRVQTLKPATVNNRDDVIDCHFHLWTSDESTPEKRAERAEQLRGEMEAQGVEKLCLIGEVGKTIEECYEANRTVAKYVEEYPDLFYGWARVDPRLGEDAVAEFQRAVKEDGLIGLKHHFMPTPVNITDEDFFPLAEAAVEMDVPIIVHVMHRLPADQPNWDPSEAYTEDVVDLAQQYPDLKLVSAHIAGGGGFEYRIKNVADQENVYLDVSGSNCERGIVEIAADRLGVERLVFGTDTWFAPGVGKLEEADLAPEEKATVAYNFEELLREDQPGRYDLADFDAKRESAIERFEADARPVEETVVDANAFVGHWPFRDLDSAAEEVVELMDQKGVDEAFVASLESTFYRNAHAGNRELREEISGHEDRLHPFATVNPSYPEWESDLRECIEEWGWEGVKLLPAYHNYDLDDPNIEALMRTCADLDVPVSISAVLEDQRGRHPRITLRGYEEEGTRSFTEAHVDELVELLRACPETDVVLADMWTHAPRVVDEVCEVHEQGTRLDNFVRSGETLFVLDDLYVYFTHQARQLVEDVGVEHLVCGPQLPFKIFGSSYRYSGMLPVIDDQRARVRSENALSLLE